MLNKGEVLVKTTNLFVYLRQANDETICRLKEGTLVLITGTNPDVPYLTQVLVNGISGYISSASLSNQAWFEMVVCP